MTQQTITVADALVRIKTTTARIETARTATFVTVRTAGRIPEFRNVTLFDQQARGAMDSVSALHLNYSALKAAIVQSNAVTLVQIGKDEMTVAAAIERKKSIEQDQALLAILRQQFNQAQRAVDHMNAQVQAAAEKAALSFFADKQDKQAPAYTDFVARYVTQNGAELVDPLNLGNIITRLSENIQDFLANVDLALTTSNVRTEITVDLA